MRTSQPTQLKELGSFQAIQAELRCVPRILITLNRRLNGPLGHDDLADLGQEVLLVVWRKLVDLEVHTSLEAWIYRICFLQMMNHLRKKRSAKHVSNVDLEEREAQVDSTTKRAERFEELHHGLELLENVEASIIRLKHYEDLPFVEVAQKLKMPIGSVKTRYYRGLLKLKEFLKNHEMEASYDPIPQH